MNELARRSAASSANATVHCNDLGAQIDALKPWFHNLRLKGIETAPEHFLGDYPQSKYARFRAALPADLSGKSVLDIGCNAGFYSLAMKRRGASRVVGIDSDDRYLAQARLAADTLGFDDVEFRRLDVYDVAALGEKFDFVIFMGVFYHLRHPLLALDLIREHVTGDMMLFQTMQQGSTDVSAVPADHPFFEPGTFRQPSLFTDPGYPKMHFIEREFAHDWTNWWAPNAACSQAMLRAAGFAIEANPEPDVYLCRIAPVPYGDCGPAAVYPHQGALR